MLGAKQKLKIASIGCPMNLTYQVNQLGNGSYIVSNIIQGKAKANRNIISAKNPFFLFGLNALQRADGASLKKAFNTVIQFRNKIHKAQKKALNTKHKF